MPDKTHRQELFVGPRPFELRDKELFFGRDREASELLSLAIAHRLLLVYAQSGAGKTSLFNTRLKPELEKEGFDVLNIVRMQIPLPDVDLDEVKNIFIYKTLLNLIDDPTPPEDLLKLSLTKYLTKRTTKINKYGLLAPRMIIFDQFEELFNLHSDRWQDRMGFFDQIRDSIEQLGNENLKETPPLWVIFVMREDYIASLDQYTSELPGKLRTRYRLERLREDEALQAVVGPLENSQISFGEGVAENLIDELLKIRVENELGDSRDVKGEYVEPVQLQLVCQSLLRNLPQNVKKISNKHIEEFGDVDKTLSEFYDEVVRTTAQQALLSEGELRDWFENALITPMGTRSSVYRGRETTVKIPNDAVDILETKHIIRAEYRAGARWYELTHDRLVEPIKASNKRYQTGRIEDDYQKALRSYLQGERARDKNDKKEALIHFNVAKDLYVKIGDQKSVAATLLKIAEIELDQYEARRSTRTINLEQTISDLNDALIISRIINDKWEIASTLALLARTYDLRKDQAKARQFRNQILDEIKREPKEEAQRLFTRLRREYPPFQDTFYEDEFKKAQANYQSVKHAAEDTEGVFFHNLHLTPRMGVRATYDDKMAWVLASMCQLVDGQPDRDSSNDDLFVAKLDMGGFSLVETFKVENNLAAFLMVKKDDYGILVFRWDGDAPKDSKQNNVHDSIDSKAQKGKTTNIVGAYRYIERQIESSILKLNGIPLYVTGYYFGAILALIATQYLEKHQKIGNQIAACYTFGSPRVSEDQIYPDYKSAIYRVVNTDDVFAFFPLFSIGYNHVGEPRFLGQKDGDVRRTISISESFTLVLMAFLRPLSPFQVSHAIEDYRKRLKVVAQIQDATLFKQEQPEEKDIKITEAGRVEETVTKVKKKLTSKALKSYFNEHELAAARSYFGANKDLLDFPVTGARYSDRAAWVMASMAHLAYDRFEDDELWRELLVEKLRGGRFRLLDVFDSPETDTQALLVSNGEYAVLAFRGTEVRKTKDILTDVRVFQVSAIEGRVHRGFLQSYKSIEQQLLERLKLVEGLPLYITGHALGAALAVIATQYLERDSAIQGQIAACYTFGSPRIGNQEFDRNFSSIVHRVVNTADIVTVVPLLAMGYIHVGNVHFLGRKDGEIRTGIPFLQRIFLFYMAMFRLFGPLIGNNAISEYRRKLEIIARESKRDLV